MMISTTEMNVAAFISMVTFMLRHPPSGTWPPGSRYSVALIGLISCRRKSAQLHFVEQVFDKVTGIQRPDPANSQPTAGGALPQSRWDQRVGPDGE